MTKIRTRIAPSPTGDPHVGLAYIALFNYVFAKANEGECYIRIEDTDQKRCTKESENRIFEALNWLELDFSKLNNFALRQSSRLDIYKKYAEVLLAENKAYKCYCSKGQSEHEQARINGGSDGTYNLFHKCLTSEISETFVIRLKSKDGEISFNDGLRGKITSNTYLRDPVLLKSDGYPTYHLASVVDDYLMEITHVIRGEEWISSTPIHIELYAAFGWNEPEFYHLSLLRNPDKTKLSKRKNPTSILYYRDIGILSETFLNYLGTLGFNFGKERFSIDEMIEHFSWDKVSVNGPVFDIDKLKAFNANDIKKLNPSDAHSLLFCNGKFLKIFELAKTRVSTLSEIIPLMSYCFGELPKFNERDFEDFNKIFDFSEKIDKDVLEGLLKEIETDPIELYESKIKNYFTAIGLGPKEYFPILNTIISGSRSCPPVFEIMKIIGKDITLRRIKYFIEIISR